MSAEDVVDAIKDHVEDIVMMAASDNYPDIEIPEPWTSLSSSWDRDDVDTDVSPVVYYSALRIRYSWERLPR